MNATFPVLIDFAGLGSFISCKRFALANSLIASRFPDTTPDVQKAVKPAVEPNPIDRSPANTRRNGPKPAWARFATACGLAGLRPSEDVRAEVRTAQIRNKDVCNNAANGAAFAALFPNMSSPA
jgi:hypothetical protein